MDKQENFLSAKSLPQERMSYFGHVDGLRGIAVLVVVLYHLEFKTFSGGFVGVDIFFTISGFLITRLIYNEFLTTGSFNFRHFYLRRCLRLFPALFAIFIFNLIGMSLLFSSKDMANACGSMVYTLVPLSNFYFWMEAGYFDASAKLKPFLHMWSLAVEEQFYFFWPATLFFFWRKLPRSLLLGLVFLFAFASVLITEVVLHTSQPAAFYLPFFRVFEFLIGALLVLLPKITVSSRVSGVLVFLGFTFILAPVVYYNNTTQFPGFHALIPCLGAALLIQFGNQNRISSYLLTNRLILKIGLISYSLYLIHWPLLIFWQYYNMAGLSLSDTYMLLCLSLLLAHFMHRYIETPFRSQKFIKNAVPARIGLVAITATILALLPAAHAWTSGWTWRILPLQNHDPKYTQALHLAACANGFGFCDDRNINANYVITGDSQSRRVDYLLGVAAKNASTTVSREGFLVSCLPLFDNGGACAPEMNQKLELMRTSKANHVILVGFWMGAVIYCPSPEHVPTLPFFRLLANTVKRFGDKEKKALIFGPMPYFPIGPQNCFTKPFSSSCEYAPPACFETQKMFNQTMKKVVHENGGRYFDIFSILCGENGICKMGHNGYSFYEDDVHMESTNIGAYILLDAKRAKGIDHFFL